MTEKMEVSTGKKVAMGVAGVIQVALAILAFWDLAKRDASEVRGRKGVWSPVILVNWIGPAGYFLFGIRR